MAAAVSLNLIFRTPVDPGLPVKLDGVYRVVFTTITIHAGDNNTKETVDVYLSINWVSHR